jgi:peptidoglycan-associated lipoprotein
MKMKTLLSSLFVAMILSAGCAGKGSGVVDETKDAEKAKTVQGDTAGAKTTDNGTITSDSKDANSKDLTGENQDQNVQDMTSAENKVESIYFDYDKFNIRADMQEKIEKNAVVLNNDTNKNFRVKIEGNCDEWGSDEYNYALGLRRANSAKKALVAQGFDGSRVTLVSLGEANPVCSDKTQECWQKNRRADFKVLP